MTIVERLQKHHAGRDPERLALKWALLKEDPFAFYRGTCPLFYVDLPRTTAWGKAPAAWLCGDLHLENFGAYRGDNRLTYFDVNDFDEACLAPCTWEVARFLTSVLVGAGSMRVGAADARSLAKTYLEAYRSALADGKARWVERATAEGMIRDLLTDLRGRDPVQYLNSRTVRTGMRRRIRIDGRKALRASADDRRKVLGFLREFAKRSEDPRFFRPLDVARRIAGNGSLGVERYVILVDGDGSPDGNVLLDLKYEDASALAGVTPCRQPRWPSDAERVVGVQRRLQAIAPAFLEAVQIGGKPYVLRELLPSQDRLRLKDARGKVARLAKVLRGMGEITAWGQLRSSGRQGSAAADELIDFARRGDWPRAVLAYASSYARQARRDWREFQKAYDAGAFQSSDGAGR